MYQPSQNLKNQVTQSKSMFSKLASNVARLGDIKVIKDPKISSFLGNINTRLERFNQGAYGATSGGLNVISGATMGAAEEVSKPIKNIKDVLSYPLRPVTGLIKGGVKGFKEPMAYNVGTAGVEEPLKKLGVNPALAFGLGLAAEVALPGPGELAMINKAAKAKKLAKGAEAIETIADVNKINRGTTSVLQAVNPRTGEQFFWKLPKAIFDKVNNLVDNTATGIAGIKDADGFVYHITAHTPKEMVEMGFKSMGNADPSALEITSKMLNGVPAESAASTVGIMNALSEAKKVASKQKAVYKTTRAGRISQFGEAFEKSEGGVTGLRESLSTLAGEMPKVDSSKLAEMLKQENFDDVINTIMKATDKLPSSFDRLSAAEGFMKMVGLSEGTVQPNQIKKLKTIFGDEFVEEVVKNQTSFQKATTLLGDLLNVPRTLLSSFDLSMPFRQAVTSIRRKEFWGAFGDMFKSAFSQKNYDALMDSIKSRPTYQMMLDADLPLTDLAALGTREESFMSNLASKIPLLGAGVKFSNRGAVAFLNKLRADVFDNIVKVAQKDGVDVMDGKFLNDLASYIGDTTGRGKFIKQIDSWRPFLNSAFFSPRLMASRINMLRPDLYLNPNISKTVRVERWKDMLSFLGAGMATLFLAKAAGADVGTEPTSADFGKIKVGNTRYDVWGGFQQYIRLLAQMMLGKVTSTTTGESTKFGQGYPPLTRTGVAARFLAQKESPIVAFITRWADQKDPYTGEKFNLPKDILKSITPIMAQDIYDILKEGDSLPEALVREAPAFFGVGVQTYAPKKITKPKPLSGSIKGTTNKLKPAQKLPKPSRL